MPWRPAREHLSLVERLLHPTPAATPNAPGGPLEDWIANPQAFKPGSQMPASTLRSDQLSDIAAYLQELR
jgi:cytochrome c1